MIVLYIFTVIVCALVSLALVGFITVQIVAIFTADAPFVPIPKDLEDEIVENLGLNSESVFYDLGCGDGRILIKAVEKYPGIKCVGVEIAYLPYSLAKFYTRKYKNIEIRRQNVFKTDLTSATHIFAYLYPKAMTELWPIVKEQCKPGTILMSCDFEVENVQPNKIIQTKITNSKRGQRLSVYEV